MSASLLPQGAHERKTAGFIFSSCDGHLNGLIQRLIFDVGRFDGRPILPHVAEIVGELRRFLGKCQRQRKVCTHERRGTQTVGNARHHPSTQHGQSQNPQVRPSRRRRGDGTGRFPGGSRRIHRVGPPFAEASDAQTSGGAIVRTTANREAWNEGVEPVTNSDWIAGMMSALLIAAVLWAAIAFA